MAHGAERKGMGIGPSSKFKVKSFKYEDALEISQKTWDLEHGTLNLTELPADKSGLMGEATVSGQKFQYIAK